MAGDDSGLLERFQRAQESMVLQYNELGLQTLADWVESGTIDIAPDFQRRDRWSAAKQSLLIESFLLNLPIPPVYLAEGATGEYSVIDGRQRLTTIHRFLRGELVLRGLAEFPELDGARFRDIPSAMQIALGMRALRSVTLMRQTDPELKYLVFHRLNSAGEVLNAQEIRNVAFRGPMNDMLQDLASAPFLRKQLKITGPSSSAYRKMADVEYVLRFLMLSEGWRKFSGDFAQSMDAFMDDHQYADPGELEALANRFQSALLGCEAILGDRAFKRPEGSGWRDQVIGGLYDAQMIAFHELGPGTTAELVDLRDESVEAVRRLFDDEEFDSAVRVGTNTPSRIRLRIQSMIAALADVVVGS
ncbi:DUF262 domain-containing protein [Oerskovia jenensis]|uniref:DUF262 domain-containing protein n=1 Tax=Oerskovia jenensis TaxID=162169 RepID=UPI0036D87B19